MRTSRIFSFVAVFVLCSFLAFFGMCLDVSASGGTVYHSASVVADLLGDTIDGYYLATGGVYKPLTLVRSDRIFHGNRIGSYTRSNPLSDVDFSYFDFWEYTAVLPDDASNNIVTVDLPLYVINSDIITFYTGTCHSLFFLERPTTTYSNINYTTLGSSGLNSSYFYLQSGSSRSNYPNSYWLRFDSVNDGPSDISFTGGTFNLTGSASTYNPFGDISFSHTATSPVRFFVSGVVTSPLGTIHRSGGIPTYEGDPDTSATVTGTITEDSSGDGQNINITVSQDNKGLVQSILSGIQHLFVPDQTDLRDLIVQFQDMLRARFGSFFDTIALNSRIFRSVEGLEPVTTIGLTSDVSLERFGIPYTFRSSEWRMPIVPEGDYVQDILTAFKGFQCVLYTLMFINLVRRKLDLFLNPDSEVVIEEY